MARKIIPSGSTLPYSKAAIHDSRYVMEIAGQIGLNPKTGKLEKDVEKQTIRTLENIKQILLEKGWSFDNLIKVRIFLVDMADYSKVNKIYAKYFSGEYPPRVAVAVKALPLGALIEIDCTAAGDVIKE